MKCDPSTGLAAPADNGVGSADHEEVRMETLLDLVAGKTGSVAPSADRISAGLSPCLEVLHPVLVNGSNPANPILVEDVPADSVPVPPVAVDSVPQMPSRRKPAMKQ